VTLKYDEPDVENVAQGRQDFHFKFSQDFTCQKSLTSASF